MAASAVLTSSLALLAMLAVINWLLIRYFVRRSEKSWDGKSCLSRNCYWKSQIPSADTRTHTHRKYLNCDNFGRSSAQRSGQESGLNPFLFWVCRGSPAAPGQSDLCCPCRIALLSIPVHACAQALSHQEVTAHFQPWKHPESLSGSTWLSLHDLPESPAILQPRFTHSPALWSHRGGGVDISPLGFIPSCAVDWPGHKRGSHQKAHLSFKQKWYRLLIRTSSYQINLFSPFSPSLPPFLTIIPHLSCFHWHPSRAPQVAELLGQPGLWGALRSNCDANHVFSPFSLPHSLCSWGGWRWRHGVGTFPLRTKASVRTTAQRGRIFHPHEHVYKCGVWIEREGKKQTLSGWVRFTIQYWEVVPLCVRFPAAPHLITQDHIWRANLLLLINSWLFMAEILSFLPFLVLLHYSHLLLA